MKIRIFLVFLLSLFMFNPSVSFAKDPFSKKYERLHETRSEYFERSKRERREYRERMRRETRQRNMTVQGRRADDRRYATERNGIDLTR